MMTFCYFCKEIIDDGEVIFIGNINQFTCSDCYDSNIIDKQ